MSEIELENLKTYKQQEQETLKKIFPKHQIDLTLEYGRWDCLISDKKYLIELKNREFTYEEFLKNPGKYQGKALIEVDKYQSCLAKASQLGYKFIYIFYFSCGTTLLINLSDQSLTPIQFQEKYIKCPQYSFTEEKSMIYKLVYIIPAFLINIGYNSHLKIIK